MNMNTPARLQSNGGRLVEGLDEELITSVVASFYASAREDALLGPIFNRVIPDEMWTAHMEVIADFWSTMLLGTHRYTGRPLPKHLAMDDLRDDHFVRWLALFRATVNSLCRPPVAALFMDRAERIAQSFRLGLAFHRGEDTTKVSPIRTSDVASDLYPR